MVLKVAGCAGHGYNTSGKRTPDGEREWSFNNKVWLAFEKTLKSYEGVEVRRYDDPTGKTDVPLSTRTNGANAWGADLYVSIHHNANTGVWGTWTGTETYTYGSGKSLEIGRVLQSALVSAFGLKDRGLKVKDLHIIKYTNMPAALVECAYMDSVIDIKKMRNDAILNQAGTNMANAIAKMYGLKLKQSTQTIQSIQPTKQPSIIYSAHVQEIGWQKEVANGQTAGTTGKELRMEALTVKLKNTDAKLEMQGHVQGKGWTSVRTDGEVVGTMGKELRLEAISLNCDKHKLQYRVHVQGIGWQEWRNNGQIAGTVGQGLRIEAIEIKLV